jgi:hypothetical protein
MFIQILKLQLRAETLVGSEVEWPLLMYDFNEIWDVLIEFS